jgi:hypothetical protein
MYVVETRWKVAGSEQGKLKQGNIGVEADEPFLFVSTYNHGTTHVRVN